jgi:hypothetical protein
MSQQCDDQVMSRRDARLRRVVTLDYEPSVTTEVRALFCHSLTPLP